MVGKKNSFKEKISEHNKKLKWVKTTVEHKHTQTTNNQHQHYFTLHKQYAHT